jgi:uncharacterized membrane protein
MCLGLGYPTLNRYDPRKLLPDSASYRTLATAGPATVPEPFRFRVLEPYLVRPLYVLAQGHVGSWDPLWFGFLLVNSLFVASTALLLFRVGSTQFGNHSTALVAATLYLLNFAISNAQLAGLVDASEGFFLMAVVVSLLVGRRWLLPVLGVFGALAKESFVPFSVTMAGAWWLLSKSAPPREQANRLGAGLSIAAMAIAELLTVTILQSSITARLVWPWNFAAGLNSHSNHATTLLVSLLDKDSWYILIWLLPLGLVRIRQFPRPWVGASAAAALVALLLNAYHTLPGAEGGMGRYLFNIAGPLLSLSAAVFLCDRTPRPKALSPAD